MRCPYCGSENENGKFCENCGADLRAQQSAFTPDKMVMMSGTAASLSRKTRAMRMLEEVSEDKIIPDRTYNLIIGATVLWGLLVNILMCFTLGDKAAELNPIALYFIYFAMCFTGIILSKNSKNAILSFIGYNLVVVPLGLVLSITVELFLRTDPQIVTNAFFYTILICVGMIGAVMAFPDFFAKLGGILTACLFGMLFCEVLLLLFRVQQNLTDWICAGMFSLYVGYDIYRAQQFPKTVDNAVDSALDIYLDIANLFIRILSIMARSKKRD